MNRLLTEVLAALMTAQGWCEYGPMIDADMLPDTAMKVVYDLIAQARANHVDHDLTPDDLEIMLLAACHQDPERRKEIHDAIPKTQPTSNQATRDAAIRDYVSRQHIARAIQYGATHLHSADLDPAVVLDHAARSVEVRRGRGTDIARYSESPLPGTFDDRPGCVGLGVSVQLDRALGGGLAAGELGILLAPPARGKTSVLCTVGALAAVKGTQPVHITLEISDSRVYGRYDVALTHLTYTELQLRPDSVEPVRARLRERKCDPIVTDWSYTDVAPSDIRTLITRARANGDNPGIVIVDYLELMIPNRTKGLSRREQRHVWGQLGKDMRMLAVELQLPILTAWQINREGSGLDTTGMEHVSECWDMVKHADVLVAINQNPSEERHKTARFCILKQRDNTERNVQYPVRYDLDRCIIEDMEIRWTGAAVVRKDTTTNEITEVGSPEDLPTPAPEGAGQGQALDDGPQTSS